MQKQIKLKVPNKSVQRQTMQRFQIHGLKGGHRQRKQKKEKENQCGRNERTRREERKNRWTNGWTKGWHKEVTHACEKGSFEKYFSTKGKWLFKKKNSRKWR